MLVLIALGLFYQTLYAQDPCYVGFDPVNTSSSPGENRPNYRAHKHRALLHPDIIDWMRHKQWPEAYALWQHDSYCSAGFEICKNTKRALFCADKHSSLQYLLMNRYLLSSVRALWPQLEQSFSAWTQFPQAEDFPDFMQSQIRPWPEATQQAAKILDRLMMLDKEEIQERWPSEQDFAHWIFCGTENPDTDFGFHANALFPTLTNNGITSGTGLLNSTSPLEEYYFWQAIAWLDRAWDKYRMTLRKTPYDAELQAELIMQCQALSEWQTVAAKKVAANQKNLQVYPSAPPLFMDGGLNPLRVGDQIIILAEITEILSTNTGSAWLKIDPKLMGVRALWLGVPMAMAEDTLKLGRPYEFVGYVRSTENLLDAWQEQKKQPAFLVAQTIQTVK